MHGTAYRRWVEPELLVAGGRAARTEAVVVVLRTRGCDWFLKGGGCTECGYNSLPTEKVDAGAIAAQFRVAVATTSEKPGMVKVYTSGSFLDDGEVPGAARLEILSTAFAAGFSRVVVESRIAHIDRAKAGGFADAVREAGGRPEQVEVAVGLESASPEVLGYSLNKPQTVEGFAAAAKAVREAGFGLRSYVLLKPPFLTEKEAVADAIRTVEAAAPFSTTISINPVDVQRGTRVEYLWRRGLFRPPYLWSVAEVLRASARFSVDGGPRLLSKPTGGGYARGAHNCGRCDGVLLDAIGRFSLTYPQAGATAPLDVPPCRCRDEYAAVLELEGFAQGAQA